MTPSDQKILTGIPSTTLRNLYSTMLRIRRVEERIADILENSSEIVCPVHLYIGQEAVATGVCANLHQEDYVFSTHRSHGHYIAKGGDINALVAEIYGKITGCSRGRGGSMHLASPDIGLPGSSAIVAGTIPLAVGAALAFSLQKNKNIAICFFGDGAVSEGVFYESLNLASLKKLPVVFVCENNLYSTHMPIASCLADTEICEKAKAFDLPGLKVDGNNVIEVYNVAKEAIKATRSGKGPVLIECLTYRWRGHVGSNYDIDKGLRSQEELDSWVERCPVKMLEEFLLANNVILESDRDQIRHDIDEEIEAAITFARESPYPKGEDATRGVFKSETV
ncbi:thiamine pyrophosphate-dependent dehydrogenase E1 component subunit alpha [Chloroflexota bacterium]